MLNKYVNCKIIIGSIHHQRTNLLTRSIVKNRKRHIHNNNDDSDFWYSIIYLFIIDKILVQDICIFPS